MDIQNLVAIDVHTHAEVSQRLPADPAWKAMQEASKDYFKDEGPRPTIPEIAAYYRERKMACVIFPVDMESTTGLLRVPNEEVAEGAAANPDVLIPFASIDPAKGKLGAPDYPLITPDRWLADFEQIPIRPEVRPLILKENAIKLLGLDRSSSSQK
jgi:predicted TIM-barrel fold metal-dependent hydrolase